jgi:hypothetical protein
MEARMNLIVTSEHRVGSRWLHYLLADLYGMDTSPEMDVKRVGEVNEIRSRFQQRKIVKFHHATQADILEALEPWNYNIIAVVRNPMDRMVSLTFHNRYHKKKEVFKQSEFETDQEAVKYTVVDDPFAKQYNENQAKLMLQGYSTRNKTLDKLPYIWTCYEWMHKDIFGEIRAITDWLGVEGVDDDFLKSICMRHSFKAKTKGRGEGQEDRSDLWRRKGVLGDWKNWYDEDMIEASRDVQFRYQDIIEQEITNGNT